MDKKTILDTEEFEKYKARWMHRQAELKRRKSYYDGSVYKESVFKHSETLGMNAYGLYKHMRPLYLPLSRAVDVDAGVIPGDWAFPDSLTNLEAVTLARDTLFDWSNWNTEGVLFVHYGAMYGVTGLKICDIYGDDGNYIIIEPLDPMTFMFIDGGVLIIENRIGDDGKDYEYAEVITAEQIRTYKNGVLFAFDGQEQEWPNNLEFIPVLEAQHIKTGEMYGESTYQKAIPMLSELNGLASYLADIVRKHSEPQWAVFGTEPSDLTKSGDNVWFFPMQGSDARPLVAPVDVTGILEFLREIKGNVHDALPELSFDELRKKDQVATATIELQLMELTIKIKRSRPNYDQCLADALMLIGQAATKFGIKELTPLDSEDIEFDQNREIIPMDAKTRMELEMSKIELDNLQRGSTNEGMSG